MCLLGSDQANRKSIIFKYVMKDRTLRVGDPLLVRRDFEKRAFTFNEVFKDENNSQHKVFQSVAQPIVESVLGGMSGSILAYGQTGTGKTYTIIGNQDGILPMSVNYILKNNGNDSIHLSISAMQIYNENISDLLVSDPSASKPIPKELKVKQVMETLHTKEISCYRDARECFEIAQKLRCVGSTSMNSKSSRSHAIFILNVFNKKTDIKSTLYLVDLAGSERIKKSNVSGERIDEAIAINSSLTTLGKCIIALGEKKPTHVPYRESKLTKILQDALGGKCKTALILTLSPQIDDLEETISSLLFGQRAKKVQCKPIAQERYEPKTTLEELRKQLDVKTQLLNEVSAENRRLQNEIKALLGDTSLKKEEQIKKLELKMKMLKKEHQTRLEDMDSIMLVQEKEISKLKERLSMAQSSANNSKDSIRESDFRSGLFEDEPTTKLRFPEVNTLQEITGTNIIRHKVRYTQQPGAANKENVREISLEEVLCQDFSDKPKKDSLSNDQSKRAELEKAVEQMATRIKNLETENQKLLKDNHNLVSENDTLLSEHRHTPRNIEPHHLSPLSNSAVESMRCQIDDLKEEVEIMREEISYLKEMNQNLESENQALEEELVLNRDHSVTEESALLQEENSKLKTEIDKLKEKSSQLGCENYTVTDENIKMAKQIAELKEKEAKLMEELNEVSRRLVDKPVQQISTRPADYHSNQLDREKDQARITQLERELEQWRRRSEEKDYNLTSIQNDMAALEAQLKISKIKSDELASQNSKLDQTLKMMEGITMEKEGSLCQEIAVQKRQATESSKEMKRLVDHLQSVESDKRDLENILEEYRKKEQSNQTQEQELERMKGLLLETDNWNSVKPVQKGDSSKNNSSCNRMNMILEEAKSKIKEYIRNNKARTDSSRGLDCKKKEIETILEVSSQSIKKTMISFFSQVYFYDFEKNILSVSSGHQLQQTLVREYIKSRQCLREMSVSFESLLGSLIESEYLQKAEADKQNSAEACLRKFKKVLSDPAFDKIREEFIRIWSIQYKQNQAAITLQNFFKKIKQQKKLQRLQKRHKSQYERFQAGSGKNLLQMLMKKTEDSFCYLYEHLGPVDEEVKQLMKRKTQKN